jgi:hypothetical protein
VEGGEVVPNATPGFFSAANSWTKGINDGASAIFLQRRIGDFSPVAHSLLRPIFPIRKEFQTYPKYHKGRIVQIKTKLNEL